MQQLLSTFTPKHYKLELDVNREGLSFSGTTEIQGVLQEPKGYIPLHAHALEINKATIDGKAATVTQHDHDEIRLNLEGLAQGEHVVTLKFTGVIQDGAMTGMYVSNFVHDGTPKQLVATQFESHYARSVFPCVDEPAAKSTFQLTVTSPSGEPILSNTLPESSSEADGRVTTTFKTTPVMSTYLLALAFGEMHCVESKTKAGTLVRSWASVAQPRSWLQYSLDEAVRVLEFFTNYFGTPYPLEKCDQLALPDFDAGAMENWGLVTYRELALISDPDNRSLSTEQYVSLVIAHELSHQWFGNLVTMQWWDDLWLNESFASMMEHLALDAVHPDWNQWEDYTSSDIVVTSNRDTFSDVQAIRVVVDSPELLDTIFDPAIVYAKGGRLLKMLREYIGDGAFKAGLQAYFKKHAYGNTSRDDLWACLSASSGKNINELMDPWLEQSGMPVVTVTQTGQNSDVSLRQSRFLLDQKSAGAELWHVPLLSAHASVPEILTESQTTFTAKGYIQLNKNGSGHYLTHYAEAEHRAALATMMREKQIGAEGRIILFNDSLLLAKRGDLSITDVLDLAIGNQDEDRDAVWGLMAYAIGMARTLTEGDKPTRKRLVSIYADMLANEHERLGWDTQDGEDPNTTHLRLTALSSQVSAKREPALQTALDLFESHKQSLTEIPADLRGIVLAASVEHTPGAVKALVAEYKKSQSADLQLTITSALTSTKDPAVAKMLVSEVLDPKHKVVRPQDFLMWAVRLMGNHHTREVMWDYVEQNWTVVKNVLNNSKSYDYFPIYAARQLNTEAWLNRYLAFFEPKRSDKILERNIEVALNDIRSRIEWRRRDEKRIVDWAASKQ